MDAAGIDMIEISGGTYEAPAMAGAKAEKRKASQPLPVKPISSIFAEKIRQASEVSFNGDRWFPYRSRYECSFGQWCM